jgi:hypothetical protein
MLTLTCPVAQDVQRLERKNNAKYALGEESNDRGRKGVRDNKEDKISDTFVRIES